MQKAKTDKLKKTGWRTGSAAEFLELTAEEAELIEMKLALAAGIRRHRLRRKLTQGQLAKLLGSSQSRVAKMESADVTVSLDLMIRSLLNLGASRRDVARLIGSTKKAA